MMCHMPLTFVGVVACLALGVRGAEHIVTDRSSMKQWFPGAGYATIKAKVGDTVIFNFQGGHDVYKMSDATCGNTGNTELANKTVGGGAAIGLTNKFTYTVNKADVTAGAIFFACSVSNYTHCAAGQKITVNTTMATMATKSNTTMAPKSNTTMAPTKAPATTGSNTTSAGSAPHVPFVCMLATGLLSGLHALLA